MIIKCEEFKSTHVILELVNTEDNRKMLNEIPHRNFNDSSIIYRYVFHMDNNGILSCIIDNALAEKLKLTEKVLYALAVINTQQMFPATVESIHNVIGHFGPVNC